MSILAVLIRDPMVLTRTEQALLLLPLCLAVSVVYKTTKVAELRQLPAAIVVSWTTIVLGMYGVGIGLYLVYRIAS